MFEPVDVKSFALITKHLMQLILIDWSAPLTVDSMAELD